MVNEFFNFNDLKLKLQNGSMNISDISEHELQYMQVVSLVTGDEFLNSFDLDLNTNQFYSYLKDITLDLKDKISYFKVIHMNIYLGVHLSTVITSNGFCYSFNLPDADKFFQLEKVDEIFHYKRNIKLLSRVENSRSFGYDPSKLNDTYPRNTEYAFSGFSSNLKIVDGVVNKAKKLKSDYATFYNSFEVEGDFYYFHSPYDIITKSTANMRTIINATRYVLITPKLKMIDEALNDYEPTRRGCYLENERNLYFFRNYTRFNCQSECLANKTLESCGCVQFFMVRDEKTRICGVKDMKCYKNVENTIDKDHCRCLMKCGEIQYEIEIKQNEFLR